MSDYPKLLWLKNGQEVTVHADSEVQKLIEDGVYTPPVKTAPPEAGEAVSDETAPDEPEGPTLGPPDDDTHAKRSRKKK